MKACNFHAILLVILFYVDNGQSVCDYDLLESVWRNVWKMNPLTNLTSEVDGSWTVVKADLKHVKREGNLKCWRQIIDSREALGTDLFYLGVSEDPVEVRRHIFDGRGFILQGQPVGAQNHPDYVYPLYLSDVAAAWYVCGGDVESHVVVSVRDAAHQDVHGTREALRLAEDTLSRIGQRTPPLIPTECPAGTSNAAPSSQFFLPLDDLGNHILYWTSNYEDQRLFLELHSKISTGAWIALGFSDNTEISNSDFCMLWTDSQNTSRFQDIWTDESGIVHVDDQQDCFYQGFKHDNGEVVSIFSRRLDTCDDHDKVIEDGTMHVVWAVGPGPVASADGVNASAAQHGYVSTRLLRPVHTDPPPPADAWTIDVSQQNFNVPKTDTRWCKQVQLPQKLKRKHHIVKFESVVTPGNERLVRHMSLRQCEGPIRPTEGVCDELGFRTSCIKELAVGPGDFSFPEEAGFVLGGTDSPIYAVLEIHYMPPDNKKDRVDSSGLRLLVTPSLRPHDAGVLQLGLESTGPAVVPPGQRRLPLTSRCVPSCTAVSLPLEGITIFASRLHSHTAAMGMVTRHVRGGVELPEVVRDNHHDSQYEPMWPLRRSDKVLPGDELITTCWFDTTNLSNVTLMGLGPDEMCLDFVYYYPKMELTVCKSSPTHESFDNYFGKTNRKIVWTPEEVAGLLDLDSHSPIDAQCFLGESEIKEAAGNWNNLTVSPVKHALPTPLRQCWMLH